MNTTKPAAATWVESATERLLDHATMAIAYLYWKVCDHDDRATLERIRVSGDGSNRSQHCRRRHSSLAR